MSMSIAEFRRLGIYEETPDRQECNLSDGKVVDISDFPPSIIHLLTNPRGPSHGGDPSRQDSSVITSLLKRGIKPADVYATFLNTPRGQDTIVRKNGHSDDYLTRTIEKAQAFLLSNSISVDFSNPSIESKGTGLTSVRADKIEVSRVNWIWRGYIPSGKLTLIAGDPGMGKSTLVGDIIARITKGTFLPSGERSGVTGTCLIASGEDAASDTIIPRLIACGANLKRVEIIGEIRTEIEVGSETKFLTFPRDLDLFKQRIILTGARIAIIDPLSAFISGGVDSHKDHDIRRILSPLETISHVTSCAIIVVAHLNKNEEKKVLYRVGGTIGFVGAARSVLGVTRLSEEKNVLFSLKSTLSRNPPSLSYKIKSKQVTRNNNNTWLGDEDKIHSTTIEWLGEVDYNPHATNQVVLPEDRIMQSSQDFLSQILRDGEVNSNQIYSEGKSVGISRSHINRAKSLMNINAILRNGQWFWRLPE